MNHSLWNRLIVAIVAYLYGSIPFGYLFTRLFAHKKVYEHGTGTIGVANTFMVGGKRAGYLTVFGEASLFLSFYTTITIGLIWTATSILLKKKPVFPFMFQAFPILFYCICLKTMWPIWFSGCV